MEQPENITNLWTLSQQVIDWFVFTVCLRYILAKWVAQYLGHILKRWLIKTEEHAIYWLHFRDRAIGHGHDYDTPEACPDGVCKKLK